jgi:hypothetical protein
MNLDKDKLIRNTLMYSTGIFWTLAYIFIIARGFQDSTYGMPFVSLCLNITWEFIFSFYIIHEKPQRYVDRFWVALDVIILFQLIVFGKSYFLPTLSYTAFYLIILVAIVLSFLLIVLITKQTNDTKHGKYTAFGSNLLMSILFVNMLLQRNSIAGQSIYIALFKMLGTTAASIYFYRNNPKNKLLNFLYITTFLFDLAYFILLCQMCLQQGINPWLRF